MRKPVMIIGAIGLILCTWSLPLVATMAAELPSWYPSPDQFQMIGKIDWISNRSGAIVIGDREFTLDENVVIHSLEREHEHKRALNKGKKCAFSSNGRKIINEIWILPEHYRLPNER